MSILYVNKRFPFAERVDLIILHDRYGFRTPELDEIKTNWVVDPTNPNIYCKPNSSYAKQFTIRSSNPQEI